MPPTLELEQVSRTFSGNEVVHDVSFSVEAGSIFALLGPNGAGKTTIARMCSTVLVPTSGKVEVCGVDAAAQPMRARKRIGLVLGGNQGFYPRASVRRNLEFFADLAAVDNRRAEVERVLEQVRLESKRDVKFQDLSQGMKQRLHLARALLGAPPLLILDEPTNGLDPELSLHMRDLIRSIAREGTAILLTSHILAEVEELADTIAIITAGSILFQGSKSELVQVSNVRSTSTFEVSAGRWKSIEASLCRLPEHCKVQRIEAHGRWKIQILWPEMVADAQALIADAFEAVPKDLVTRPATLEENYLSLVRGVS